MTDDEKLRLFARAIIEMVPKPGAAEPSAVVARCSQRVVEFMAANEISPPALEMLRQREDLPIDLWEVVAPYLRGRTRGRRDPLAGWAAIFVDLTDADLDRMQELLGDELPGYAD
jgi:hypothetical protein